MNILAMNIPNYFDDSIINEQLDVHPPLGLAIITSALRKEGHKVHQIDLNNITAKAVMNKDITLRRFRQCGSEKFDASEVLKFADIQTPELIFLSQPMIADIESARLFLSICRTLKQRFAAKIIVGGSYRLLGFSRWAINKGYFDLHIFGAGEKAISAILNCKDLACLEEREEDMPDLNILPDFSDYDLDSYHGIIPYYFSYGCPNSCGFCVSSRFKGKLVYLEGEKAAHNVNKLARTHRCNRFCFYNNYINSSPKFRDFLVNIEPGIIWSDCAHERELTKKDLFMMRKKGCIRLVFGFETGSRSLLAKCGKRLNLDHLSKVLEWSHEAGIWNGLELIPGLPFENEFDVAETLNFLRNNLQYLDNLYISRFKLERKSLMAEKPNNYGLRNVKFKEGRSFLESEYLDIFGSFDEKDGLKWNRKKIQTDMTEIRLKRFISKFGLEPFWGDISYLFNYYEDGLSKKNIRRRYKIARKKVSTKHSIKQAIR